ncbi:MAG TPA: amino acid adenylation domain-containing protein [Rhodocyclaceae bacterium]|nr:amino acid adenylation domain-containing protein [Rhodocyclaceae bacterium]
MGNAKDFQSDEHTNGILHPASMQTTSTVGPLTAEQLAYWRQNLSGAPALLELPTDYPRPAIQSKRLARLPFVANASTAAALNTLAHAAGVSLQDVALSAFAILLSRYSGQSDVVLGFASSSFNSSITPAILRCELSDGLRFVEIAKLLHAKRIDAGKHPRIGRELIAEALGFTTSSSHALLTQALLLIDATHADEVSDFDLVLNLTDSDSLQGEFLYAVDLFKPTTIERMTAHFLNLLDSAASNIGAPASSHSILSSDEHQKIIIDWNATDANFPEACAHELFEAKVRERPHGRAVVFGEQSLSYAELNTRANQLAHYLIAHNVGPDVLVGVCVKRSVDMVVALLAILKAGGAYVPLDPAYPADRLAYMIDDAKPALLLTQEVLLGLLGHAECKVFCLDRDQPLLRDRPEHDPTGRAMPSTLAYVIYTSGSTGKPKGVALEHRGLSNLCVAQGDAFEVDEHSQVLQFASISFDAAVSETFVTFAKGACLHLIRQESLRSAYEIMSLIERSRISVVTLPPSLLAVLPKKALPALRTLVLAGEAWSPELARHWGSGRRLLNAYGPTEGTVCATWFEVDAGIEHIVPIGKPLQNVKVYILDPNGQPVPVGVAGELYIAGPNLARAYLRQPELTVERFILNPFSNEYCGRMYRTGDKARYLEDGNIEFLGRIDNQVKLRGYRIELGEIEATLTTHTDVKDAVVMVREDHPGERRLVAYVISNNDLTPELLKSHLKCTLPDYMLPQSFVFLQALPMSPNGKVDRKSLPPPGTLP